MTFKKKLKLTAAGIAAISTSLLASTASADQVILDDLIVDGSICAGMDCVNGESFGFDTLRLKENNLRIRFVDTSSTSSFPSRDWQLTANDSSNGGLNKFSIDDIDGGRTPFTVEAGAPSHSLYVDDAGRIGLGKSTPVVEMHIADGDSPTVRLEQDGTSGFTPQTWDMAGNEANFFIRDATNGSQLPFKIKPGADSNSLFVAANNDIGVGTDSPAQSLHVRRTDDATIYVQNTTATPGIRSQVFLENAGGAIMSMHESVSGNIWNLVGGSFFGVQLQGTSGALFSVATNGNATVTGTMTTGGGTCGSGCDKVFDADYDLPSIEDHAEEMFANRHLPNVGPTVENAPINVSDKLGRMLNELEKAHIYIADLNEQNKSMAAENIELAAANERLAIANEAINARLERIEQKLQ